MIRRLKKDVLSELPSKRRSKVQIEPDPKYLKKLDGLLDMMRGESGYEGHDIIDKVLGNNLDLD